MFLFRMTNFHNGLGGGGSSVSPPPPFYVIWKVVVTRVVNYFFLVNVCIPFRPIKIYPLWRRTTQIERPLVIRPCLFENCLDENNVIKFGLHIRYRKKFLTMKNHKTVCTWIFISGPMCTGLEPSVRVPCDKK